MINITVHYVCNILFMVSSKYVSPINYKVRLYVWICSSGNISMMCNKKK